MIITKQEFEYLVPDSGIREFLSSGLDEDNLLCSVTDFVPIFQNTVNLAFLYAFSCYLDLKNNSFDGKSTKLEECVKRGNSNSQRVIRTMQSIYKKYPLSAELIQFVLADIHYDFIQGENACLKRYFPNCVSAGDYWCDKGGVGLNDYFTFINENANSTRVEKGMKGEFFTLEVASKYLRDLLGFFPFLRTTRLLFDEETKWFTFVIDNYSDSIYTSGIVDTFGLISKFASIGYLFLSSVESEVLKYESPRLNKFLSCPLVGVNGETAYSKKDKGAYKKPYNIPFDYETVMSYIDADLLSDGDENGVGVSMEQLFNINYKYMKNLSLAIADVIGKRNYRGAGERLKDVFIKDYRYAFENYTDETKNWDSIVVILLIEAGPSNVLREVFYALDDMGDDEVVRNIRRRFGSMISKSFADIKNGDDFTSKAKEILGERYIRASGGNAELEKYNQELLAKAKTQIVLSALLEAEKEGDKEKDLDIFHTDPVKQNTMLLEAVAKSSDTGYKIEMVEKLLGDTMRRLICFYKGIFSYGEKKIEFDNEVRKKFLSAKDIKKHQLKAEEAFYVSAKREAERLDNITSAAELVKEFVSMCDGCCRSDISVALNRSAQSRQLYAVLGKNSIMNMNAFGKIIDTKTIYSITEQNVDWWIETTIKMFKFFQDGVVAEEKRAPRSFNAIAPLVASYNKHSDSKDGYDTATFTLIFDVNEISGKNMEINMLSEFSYEISMRYYCLPNIVRSNNKWWIDPFVIKCNDFDKIIFEKG